MRNGCDTMNKNKELLSPAGNFDSLKQAVFNGCDAVYLACKDFGARKFANNFSNGEIIDAIKFCHLYGVKVYVTMNTLIKNNEVDDFINQIRFLHKNGVDAVLVQDFGMICLLREKFPNLEIHASTQANTSSYDTCKFYKELGVKRVVFSRELSIDEIDSIDIDIEKEAFIHGALCISYSGCCLMSSMLGGRSGNRGECAGCCRMKYSLLDGDNTIVSNKYLLSTKELNTSYKIDDLLKSSIYSFKIEGRMKSPLYVASITNLYRRLIDGEEIDLNIENNKLKTIFNREFTYGRLFNETDNNIINSSSPNHIGLKIGKCQLSKDKIKIILDDNFELNQGDAIRFLNSNKGMIVNYLYDSNMKLTNKCLGGICYVDNKIGLDSSDNVSKTQDYLLGLEYEKKNNINKIKINYKVIAHKGEKLYISVSDFENNIELYGNIVEEAQNAPTDYSTIEKHLNKVNDTPYIINDIQYDIDDNVFIKIKNINDLRRQLIEKLSDIRMNKNKEFIEKDVSFNFNNESNNRIITAYVNNNEQLRACIDSNVDKIYVSDYDLYLKNKDNKKIYYVIPRCTFDISSKLTNNNFVSDYFDFSNNNCIGNYTLNVFNIYTAYYLKKYGLLNVPISVELRCDEIDEFIKLYNNKFGNSNFELLQYGRVENMIIKGNILGIEENKYTYKLVDEKNRKFPVYYDGVNTHIYNYLFRDKYDINCSIRLDFYDEDYSTVKNIVKKNQI